MRRGVRKYIKKFVFRLGFIFFFSWSSFSRLPPPSPRALLEKPDLRGVGASRREKKSEKAKRILGNEKFVRVRMESGGSG